MTAIRPDLVVVHDEPVGRKDADSVLRVEIPDSPDGLQRYEQLWAARIGDSRFRLRCIPFAAYGFSLGDIVEAPERGTHGYVIARVVEQSGRRVVRAWLGSSARSTWDQVEQLIQAHMLLREFRKPALLAIDVPGDESGDEIEAEIRQLADSGQLEYERGDLPYNRP